MSIGASAATSPKRQAAGASASGAERRSRSEELEDARALRDGQRRARDRPAALGHFLLAAVPGAPSRDASAAAQQRDRELMEAAAFEGATLLKELRPEASVDYRYWMKKAGLAGLVALAEQTPRPPEARGWALEAIATYGAERSESARALLERAALIAADLTVESSRGLSAGEAARFLYSQAGAAGAAKLQKLPFPYKIVKGYGEPSAATAAPGPRVFSLDADANVVASQVFGRPMLGTLSALSDDQDNATDYLLVGKPAAWQVTRGSFEPNLYPEGGDEERTYQAVVLAFHGTEEGYMRPPDVIELLGAPSQLQLPVPSCTWLVTPPYEYADDAEQAAAAAKKADIEGDINELGELAHRVAAWGGESLIQLQVGFSIGYAGGGASYFGSWLLRSSATGLKGAGCFMTQGHQLLAGNWRADGSRDHEQNDEVWLMREKPLARASDGPPALLFQPSGAAPKTHRVATYDAKLARYRIGRPTPGAAFKPTATPPVVYDWH